MSASTAKRAYLRNANKQYGTFLEDVPREQWPEPAPPGAVYVFRSSRFLVTVYSEPQGFRLSVIRTAIKPMSGQWMDGISWDDLQSIKKECGYGDWYGVEVYPRECDKVNVANMRHLWIFPDPLPVGWFTKVRS